jgi:hypothetical protein
MNRQREGDTDAPSNSVDGGQFFIDKSVPSSLRKVLLKSLGN